MKNLFNVEEKCPSFGYILEKWEQTGYRATAIAYLQREKLFAIEHINGNWYSLISLKNAIIN